MSPPRRQWISPGFGSTRDQVLVPHRVTDLVAQLHLFKQYGEIHPLHAAGGADEAAIDDFVRQSYRLEYLGALVGLQGGDAHFRHDLQHALGNALLVRSNN